MTILDMADQTVARRTTVLTRLEAETDGMQRRAPALDATASYPLADMGMLRLLGSGNFSVARLIEEHLNAIRLIVQCGTHAQATAMARVVLGATSSDCG